MSLFFIEFNLTAIGLARHRDQPCFAIVPTPVFKNQGAVPVQLGKVAEIDAVIDDIGEPLISSHASTILCNYAN
jgi:hypothetical protein